MMPADLTEMAHSKRYIYANDYTTLRNTIIILKTLCRGEERRERRHSSGRESNPSETWT
jgi:hypothetical protein